MPASTHRKPPPTEEPSSLKMPGQRGTLWQRLIGTPAPDAAPADKTDTGEPGRLRRHHLYDAIGDFLIAHDLDFTAVNFGWVHDYLTGNDRRLVGEFDRALAEGALSNAWLEGFAARPVEGMITTEMLAATAKLVERELGQCVALLKRSGSQASDYRAALTVEMEAPAPDMMLDRLVSITRDMIEQTREAEVAMRQSQKQASDLRVTLRAARRAAEIDHLTGLPNRRGFERMLTEACVESGAGSTAVGVALCDIDHFKLINDRFGHDTGDRVLKLLGREFRTLGKAGGQVARMGGEEFAVIFRGIDMARGATLLDDLRARVAARNLKDRSSDAPVGQVTFSGGLAMVGDAKTPRAALKLADAALYAAKHGGRNRIYVSSDEGLLAPFSRSSSVSRES